MHCQHAMSCTRQPPTNALMVTAGHKGFDESKEIFMGTDGGASEGKSPSVATTGTDSISYSSNASTLGEDYRALATRCGRAQLLELKQDQDLLLGAASAIATHGLVWSVTSETNGPFTHETDARYHHGDSSTRWCRVCAWEAPLDVFSRTTETVLSLPPEELFVICEHGGDAGWVRVLRCLGRLELGWVDADKCPQSLTK